MKDLPNVSSSLVGGLANIDMRGVNPMSVIDALDAQGSTEPRNVSAEAELRAESVGGDGSSRIAKKKKKKSRSPTIASGGEGCDAPEGPSGRTGASNDGGAIDTVPGGQTSRKRSSSEGRVDPDRAAVDAGKEDSGVGSKKKKRKKGSLNPLTDPVTDLTVTIPERDECPERVGAAPSSQVEGEVGGEYAIDSSPVQHTLPTTSNVITSNAAPRTVNDSAADEGVGQKAAGGSVGLHLVDFHYDSEDVPLINDPRACSELWRQLKGGPRDMPAVEDLYFKELYVEAARNSMLAEGRWNLLVNHYDRALKKTALRLVDTKKELADERAYITAKKKEFLETAEKAVKERDSWVIRQKVEKKKAEGLAAELQKVRAQLEEVERERDSALLEKSAMASERDAAVADKNSLAAEMRNEVARLKRSREQEVTKERTRVETAMAAKAASCFEGIRLYMEKRETFEERRCILAQARGVRDSLKEMKELKILEVPDSMINYLVEKEDEFRRAADEVAVGDIPEEFLRLSPLNLPSRFVVPRPLCGLDEFGTNRDLIDPATATSMQTSGNSREGRRSVPPALPARSHSVDRVQEDCLSAANIGEGNQAGAAGEQGASKDGEQAAV